MTISPTMAKVLQINIFLDFMSWKLRGKQGHPKAWNVAWLQESRRQTICQGDLHVHLCHSTITDLISVDSSIVYYNYQLKSYHLVQKFLIWCTMRYPRVPLYPGVPDWVVPPEVKSQRIIWCVVQRKHILLKNHCALLGFKCFQRLLSMQFIHSKSFWTFIVHSVKIFKPGNRPEKWNK